MKAYNKFNIPRAKQLRKNMTPWERKLWYDFLRSYPVRFRRQAAIGDYIVDFYCPQAKLAVELDGAQHYEEAEALRDGQRTKYLETNGLTVVRIPNNEITTNFGGVCTHIHNIVSRKLEEFS